VSDEADILFSSQVEALVAEIALLKSEILDLAERVSTELTPTTLGERGLLLSFFSHANGKQSATRTERSAANAAAGQYQIQKEDGVSAVAQAVLLAQGRARLK
jgi:hypothetical protein